MSEITTLAVRAPAWGGARDATRSIARAVEQVRFEDGPGIAAWIRARLVERVPSDAILEKLVAGGRSREGAALLVQLATKNLAIVPAGTRPHGATVAGDPATHADTNATCIDGARVRTLLSIGAAGVEIAVYDGLIEDAEIEYLKSAAAPTLRPSPVLGVDFSDTRSAVRTSDGTFLKTVEHPSLVRLEQRIAAVTGIAADHGEDWQVLHYRHAQEYRPHWDYFAPATGEEHALMDHQGGNRVGTLIFYLSDVEAGGATYFPQLDLAVHAHRGTALWFAYLRDGLLDTRSQHAGMPVIRGEKWIATKWLRARPYAP